MAAQVLIVEDDPDIVTAIQVNLELVGYGVHVAHDGSQAVGIAREVRPDVVLLDVVLPGVDGVVDYIVKPFAPADLLARVRAALDEGSSK